MRGALTLAVLLCAGACASGGCGYSSRRLTNVVGARTIAVATFANTGFRRDLELRLTQAVIAELRARSAYVLAAPDAADVVLSGSMTADESVLLLDEADRPLQKSLQGRLEVRVTDRRSGQVLQSFVASAQTEYTPGRSGQSLEGSATDEWVRRLAVRVVQGLEAGF